MNDREKKLYILQCICVREASQTDKTDINSKATTTTNASDSQNDPLQLIPLLSPFLLCLSYLQPHLNTDTLPFQLDEEENAKGEKFEKPIKSRV